MKIVKLLLCLGIIAVLLGSVFLMSKKQSCENTTVTINIQPLDGITDVSGVADELINNYFVPLGMKNYKIRILPHKNTPDSALNSSHTRYRAGKILDFLHKNTPQKEFTIGITDKDISTSVHGSSDYGILGLAILGHKNRACITSTYRLKYKKDLWKLMAHEFTHGFFSQKHCSADDDGCIMQDAKGKSPKFENKRYLCSQCVSEIEQKMQ